MAEEVTKESSLSWLKQWEPTSKPKNKKTKKTQKPKFNLYRLDYPNT